MRPHPTKQLALRLKRVFSDIFVVAALAAITIGGGLNLAGVERPEIFGTLNAIFIPVGTFILLVLDRDGHAVLEHRTLRPGVCRHRGHQVRRSSR